MREVVKMEYKREEIIQKTLDLLYHNKYNIIVGKKVR